MAQPSRSSHSMQASSSPAYDGGAVIDVQARWVAQDNELALGCECANPALQIERWGQEASTVKTGFFA